jgi:cytochrome bd ubiquinol oxidase subunit I
MNYPFWDVPHIGSGWVIGLIAIFHIMISHFAVGGGLYLPLAERKAVREGRHDWLEAIKGHSKFFLILTGVFGAVSGVGIWFAIGLANPEGTSTLIHNFVFGWAMEWVFFMVELATAAVYYYTWNRVSNELHLKVGYVYAAASFCTLVIINGILAFMLTPGDSWLAVAGTGQESSRFWQAFFNPTYWPNLLMRTAVCISLAGIWSLFTCSKIDGEARPKLKTDLVRYNAKWLVPSFVALPFILAWYLWQVPESQRALLQLGMSTIGAGAFTQITRTSLIMVLTSATVVGVVYFFAWRSPLSFSRAHASAILMLGLVVTAAGEYSREMLRKPYVIGRHMYSNGVRKSEVEKFNREGYLPHSPWAAKIAATNTVEQGRLIFRGQCMACHTTDAYRSMSVLLAGRNRESIDSLLAILHDYGKTKSDVPYPYPFMPPMVGTTNEIRALGDYLQILTATSVVQQASR